MNVGFALTTIGAWDEALSELMAGISKAQEIGSAGAVRHGQMTLLCWTATYGADTRVDAALAEPRANADEAAAGTWVVRDRATLGVLFYRGCELLRGEAASLTKARSLLKTAAEAYRSTENRDVLPVALGFWAEAERRYGNAEQAVEIAREAANLVEGGAPSLLNEAMIFLALHDACVDLGDLRGARDAMQRGIAPLMRRLKGLEGTPYARTFLLGLPSTPPPSSPPPKPTAASPPRSSTSSSKPKADTPCGSDREAPLLPGASPPEGVTPRGRGRREARAPAGVSAGGREGGSECPRGARQRAPSA